VLVRLDHFDPGLKLRWHPSKILGGEQHFPLPAVPQKVQAQEHFLDLRVKG